MSNQNVSIETLKADVLPALFRDPSSIGEYGAVESNAGALDEFSNLMEGGAVTALAMGFIGVVFGIVVLGFEAARQIISRRLKRINNMLGLVAK